MFLRFDNFYHHSISSFTKVAAPLIIILKTTSIISTRILYSIILTSNVKLAILQLKQVFSKATKFYHFDLKYYIKIKTDACKYIIGDIFSKLTPESDQQHPIIFIPGIIIIEKT